MSGCCLSAHREASMGGRVRCSLPAPLAPLFGWLQRSKGCCTHPVRSHQAGARSRRDVAGEQVRVPLLRGVSVPGLREGAARLLRSCAGGAAPSGAEPACPATLHHRGASLPTGGHAGHPAHPPWLGQLHLQHPLHRQLQGDPLGGPGQAGHRQVLAGSEQEESSHAHLAERFQDILGRVPVGCRGGGERPPVPPAPQGLRPSTTDSWAPQQLLADGGPSLRAGAKHVVTIQ